MFRLHQQETEKADKTYTQFSAQPFELIHWSNGREHPLEQWKESIRVEDQRPNLSGPADHVQLTATKTEVPNLDNVHAHTVQLQY